MEKAKAHTGEVGGKDGGGTQQAKAAELFANFQKKYNLEPSSWTDGDVYQLANRLLFTDFLLENGIKARLVYVLFLNGYEFNTKDNKSVRSEAEWNKKFNGLLTKMKIKNTSVEQMLNFCYIDCCQNESR